MQMHLQPKRRPLRKALLFWVLCIGMAFIVACAHAANTEAKLEPEAVLDTARAQIDTVQKKLEVLAEKPLDDEQLADLRRTALEAQSQVETTARSIEPELVSVKARLAELGVPTEGTPEAADVAKQRKELTKAGSTLDAQIKLARLIAVEAGQASEQILKLRRAQFQAQLGQRTSSIVAPVFWNNLLAELPQDLRRLEPLREQLTAVASKTTAGTYVAVLLAIALILGLRILAGRALIRMTITRVAPGRLRRSLHATTRVLLATATPGLCVVALYLGLFANSDISAMSDTMRSSLLQTLGIACFGGFVAGLGNAVLLPNRPSWRLASISDDFASRLHWFPLTLAIIISFSWAAQRLSILLNASLVATVALDCITALMLSLTLGWTMLRIQPASRSAQDDTQALPLPLWHSFLRGTIWLTVIGSTICLLGGYVALGSFVVKQLVWIGLVLGSTYLITGLVDDTCSSLLASAKRNNGDNAHGRPWFRARSQATVLVSGIVRLVLVLFAVMLLLSPFGGGPSEWLRQIDHLHAGISIGEVQIRPISVVTAMAVLLLGFGVVKLLQRWLANQYLPTTSLDSGMRLSTATLFGYAGYVIAIALALSAVGISLERVAWIASALSVGIGFGLQAVVQNFISGLILLAEQPVKVGDWVSLGAIEGDIRRINVRATEIQMGDHSTVIVPNSEFITKVVRNVTHASPLGRVQIKLALPVNTHAEQVHDLMLLAFQENSEILEEPAPDVMLDGVDATGIIFNATGHVGSPRAAYRVRSALLFDILKRLREADLPMANPPTMVLQEASQTP